jgi:hypothetical protein
MGFFDSPTREIALALYTGGFRAGLLANFVSKLPGPLATVVELNDVELSIKREQPRVEASASVVVVGSEQKLSLKGELKATSAVRLEETLVKANFFGQSTDLQVCAVASSPYIDTLPLAPATPCPCPCPCPSPWLAGKETVPPCAPAPHILRPPFYTPSPISGPNLRTQEVRAPISSFCHFLRFFWLDACECRAI